MEFGICQWKIQFTGLHNIGVDERPKKSAVTVGRPVASAFLPAGRQVLPTNLLSPSMNESGTKSNPFKMVYVL